MVYEVEMWAFMNGAIRHVDVPDHEDVDPEAKSAMTQDEWDKEVLESIFYWGQNDHQPQEMPSVSVGDVVRLGEDRWLYCSVGRKLLDQTEYIAYTRMSPTDRILSSLRHRGD